MNYSTYRFTLDLHQTKSQYCLQIPQFSTAVQLYISLTDGGKPYLMTEDVKAVFYGKKSDGHPIIDECDIDNGTRIHYVFTQQTASCLGFVDCEIRLYDSEDNPLTLTSPKFNMLITERSVSDHDVVDSQPELSALDNILASERRRIEAENERNSNEQRRIEADLESQPMSHPRQK